MKCNFFVSTADESSFEKLNSIYKYLYRAFDPRSGIAIHEHIDPSAQEDDEAYSLIVDIRNYATLSIFQIGRGRDAAISILMSGKKTRGRRGKVIASKTYFSVDPALSFLLQTIDQLHKDSEPTRLPKRRRK